MSYDEEQARGSRTVVETPTSRREVVQTESVRNPDGNGISAGTVGVLVVMAIALITVLVLFWMNSQQSAADQNANLAAQQAPPQTTIVQQPAPAQQPPVIIQQPAPATTQPAPIIVNPPAGGMTQSQNIDSTVQAAIDKQLMDDPTFSTLGITATVMDGKVTLLGTVKTEALKSQVEKMVRRTKGVKEVDNQITVVG